MCINIKTKKFIEKSINVHDNRFERFDYSETNYINNYTKIVLICSLHGRFEQTPKVNLRGGDCQICAYTKRSESNSIDIECFIEKANIIHNNRYDYTCSVYKNAKTKIDIGCKIHGTFKQSPNSHLSGSGCPKCSGNETYTKQEFVDISNKIHNYRLDYTDTIYINNYTHVEIRCPLHGIFKQIPKNHLNGKGCLKCGKEYSSYYNLSSIKKYPEKYKGVVVKVYLIQLTDLINGDIFYKFGISIKSIKHRFSSISKRFNIICIDYIDVSIYDAVLIERYNLNRFEAYIPSIKFSGYTECFKPPIDYDIKDLKIIYSF